VYINDSIMVIIWATHKAQIWTFVNIGSLVHI